MLILEFEHIVLILGVNKKKRLETSKNLSQQTVVHVPCEIKGKSILYTFYVVLHNFL